MDNVEVANCPGEIKLFKHFQKWEKHLNVLSKVKAISKLGRIMATEAPI